MVAITRIDPGNPYAQYALGNLAYRSGRLRLADAAYARALDLDPDRPGMRLTYGHLLRDLGRLEESERQLRLAVEQTTADDVRTRASLAETLIAAQKTEEAEKILTEALEKSANDTELLAAQGRLLVATGRAAGGDPLPREGRRRNGPRALGGVGADLPPARRSREGAAKPRRRRCGGVRVTPGPWR